MGSVGFCGGVLQSGTDEASEVAPPSGMVRNPRVRWVLAISLALLLAAAFLFLAGRAKETVVLSARGVPQAVVIIPDQASSSAQMGALDLKAHLDAITGGNFEILPESRAGERPGVTRIHVGPTAAARAAGHDGFASQEFVVDVQPDAIFLVGADAEDTSRVTWDSAAGIPKIPNALRKDLLFTDLGTVYAVHEFLHRELGVRWFLPIDPGIVIPKDPNARVKVGTHRTKPWAAYRYVAGTNLWDPWCFPGSGRERKYVDPQQTLWWLVRNKVGGRPFAVNHSFTRYFARFGATHPEWWGSNTPDPGAHLEYSHPGFRAQVVQDAQDFFNGKADTASAKGDYFGVVPMDSSTGWSVTEESRALQKSEVPVPTLTPSREDPPARNSGKALTFNVGGRVWEFWNGKSSRYIWDLVNHVARAARQTHPEGKVAALAYGRYTLRPPELELEPNVAVSVTRSVFLAPHPEDHAYFRAVLEDWAAHVREFYVWEYYCHQMFAPDHLKFQKFPCITPGLIGEELDWLRGQGIQGYFYELGQMPGQGMPNIVEQMIPIYVTQRMLVDPRANGRELLADFCQSFFGAAAAPLQEFLESLEREFVDPAHWKSTTMGTPTQWWSEMADAAKARSWRALFDRAHRLAQTDLEMERVRLFDEALMQSIERHLKEYAARFQSGRRLVLEEAHSALGDLGDAGSVSILPKAGVWGVEFRGLPAGWQKVEVVLDPRRRREQVLTVTIPRTGEAEGTGGLQVSDIKVGATQATFRVHFPADLQADFQPPWAWGGDFYVWLENEPVRWTQTLRPLLDPRGFGVIRMR